ncbi:FAD-dependent oxidoreductase [Microlunatus aurantiacus]|uniref:ferredoxin--NADP(+) reductase n=1 Tax=Microlunatus aurantiacus TaxID=446786 RepID=A0ABP7CNC0_9ACTN
MTRAASDDPPPLVVAVVGAGPSGIYAAEALTQQSETPVDVTVLDRLPVPFGLVRYGVAPDHPSIRSVRNTLERTLEKTGVRFYGDVAIGVDLTADELRDSVDAVIYAFGAGSDKRLGIDGEDLEGSIAAAEFVAWYCGHPDVHPDSTDRPTAESSTGADGTSRLEQEHVTHLVSTTTDAVVVGVGNVALDVARILAKHAEELAETDMADEVLDSLDHKQVTDVHVLGRRGPAYTAFTTKELRELGQIADLDLLVDPLDLELDTSGLAVVGRDKVAARNLVVLREWAERPRGRASRRLHLHFWTRPVRILGDDRVSGVEVERTALDADGAVVGRGEPWVIPAQLVVRSVGYRGTPLPGVPFDDGTGRVPHAEGRVIRDGGFSADEYVTGWVKRGPTGVIGTNKSDAVETVTSLLHDVDDGALVPGGRVGRLTALLAERGIHPLEMDGWHRIDAAEVELGRSHGRVRTTLAHRSELLAAAEADDQAAVQR